VTIFGRESFEDRRAAKAVQAVFRLQVFIRKQLGMKFGEKPLFQKK
jgi:hypothetical protein